MEACTWWYHGLRGLTRAFAARCVVHEGMLLCHALPYLLAPRPDVDLAGSPQQAAVGTEHMLQLLHIGIIMISQHRGFCRKQGHTKTEIDTAYCQLLSNKHTLIVVFGSRSFCKPLNVAAFII